MELPKNITQIGEADRTCKIYVEDYVVSYMKQLSRQTQDKGPAIALYGKYTKEQTLSYFFIYGAPSVTGKAVDSAKSTLNSNGLEATVKGKGNKVVRQSPSADSEIPKNGRVVLYTENKSEETVKVPNFEGLTIAEANRVAASYNLNIKISGNDSTSANVVAYKQSEGYGNEVGIGTVITVSFKSNQALLD